jgi:hypothetical protein
MPSAQLHQDHPSARTLLAHHHREIEHACLLLLACVSSDEPHELLEDYCAFERQVSEHLAIEEETLLEPYAAAVPVDAEWIYADHAKIRSLLFEIGIDVELHRACAGRFHELVELLRAHTARESVSLYSWADTHLTGTEANEISGRVGRSLRIVETIRDRLRALRPGS